MEFLLEVLEEVARFFSILEELYHAWSMSPHFHVIIIGRAILAVIIIMVVMVMYGFIKFLYERRVKR